MIPLYLSRGLNYSQIALINSIFVIIKSASDYPMGHLADQIGTKVTLIIAGLLKGLGGTLLVFATHSSHFIIAFSIIGLANGCYSGADLKMFSEEKPIDMTKSIMNKVFYVQLGMASSSIIGSIITVNGNFMPPLIINCLLAWIPFILAFKLKLTPESKKSFADIEFNLIKKAFEFKTVISSNSKLFRIFIMRIFAFLTFFIQTQFIQGILVFMKVPLSYFGIIFFLKALIVGYSSRNSHFFLKYLKVNFEIAYFIFPLISLLVIFFYKILGISALFFTVFLDIATGLTSGKLVASFSNSVPKESIVAFNSIVTTMGSIIGAIGINVMGYGLDRFGFDKSFIIYFVVLSFLSHIIYIYWKKGMKVAL